MSGKTRQEFDTWLFTSGFHGHYFACESDAAYIAWKHQQDVIDARDTDLSALRESLAIQKETLSQVTANFLELKLSIESLAIELGMKP